jgi:hypothetical protein
MTDDELKGLLDAHSGETRRHLDPTSPGLIGTTVRVGFR